MKLTIELIAFALKFAETAHQGQTYGEGRSYFEGHIIPIYELALRSGCTQDVVLVAILHDIAEDTGMSASSLEEVFGFHVARCVEILTKFPGESYERYIRRIKRAGGCSKKVKILDLLCNYTACAKDGRKDLKKRYEIALLTLSGVIEDALP